MNSRVKRIVTLFLLLIFTTTMLADDVRGGAVNYSYGYNGLAKMNSYVLTMMTSVQMLLYAIAAIMTVYSSCSIYIKMNTGGDGITKDIIMLVGACLFLIGSMIVLPAFFGINYGAGKWSGWW